MPSKTFFNLDKDKQNKLIEISLKEFASYKYPDVSINKIINKKLTFQEVVSICTFKIKKNYLIT